jgi:fructuronate reductase
VKRLSNATLGDLPPNIERPGYDRTTIATGVVHLGVGAFHRAHQALVFDKAIAAGDLRWGVLGVSLRSPSVRDQMAPQDNLYSLVERDGSGQRTKVIGAVRAVLVAPEDPTAVVAALAAPDTHLATLTITEKGYKLRGGQLDLNDPDIVHDLADLAAPRTAPGFLVAGLAARRDAGLRPFTALSCDNLPHNGGLLRDAVLAIARAHDADLAAWIEQNGAFPQTMVDRIVPATTTADVDAMAGRLAMEDHVPVNTEPFFQWVIEDRFCGPRPAFETLGVQLTDDVAPWEEAKLRLLNGAHSGIAYLGGLAGVEFVHEFVADTTGRRFVEALWRESVATLTPSLSCRPHGAFLQPGAAASHPPDRDGRLAETAPAVARADRGAARARIAGRCTGIGSRRMDALAIGPRRRRGTLCRRRSARIGHRGAPRRPL